MNKVCKQSTWWISYCNSYTTDWYSIVSIFNFVSDSNIFLNFLSFHVFQKQKLIGSYKVGPPDNDKWPYKRVTGVITLLIGVMTPLRIGFWAHLVEMIHFDLHIFDYL